MDKKEMKEVLFNLLEALLALRKEIEEARCDEEVDPYTPSERRLIVELKKDYNGFFKWALDLEDGDGICHCDLAPKWKELHPDLPVPRVALLKEDPSKNFMLFLMDGYPLYLKHKEKE